MQTEEAPAPVRRRPTPWLADLYGSAVGKKYVMAITGIVLMGYVLAHMLGNLKLYWGREEMNHYGEWLRIVGAPAAPSGGVLWITRVVLVLAFGFHIHAAYGLTRRNWDARGGGYKHDPDYVAANFASRTMRWTGVIVGLFVIYHLMHFTWGNAHPDFVHGDVYHNVVEGFQQWPASVVYIVANLALGVHLYHGSWSLFQSMGWNNPRFNHWRRWFAVGFAAVIVVGNLSFPIAVLTGVVS